MYHALCSIQNVNNVFIFNLSIFRSFYDGGALLNTEHRASVTNDPPWLGIYSDVKLGQLCIFQVLSLCSSEYI